MKRIDLERLARTALAAAYLGLVGVFLVASVRRMGYRFELEWFEGLALENAWRIARGLPIYAAPTATFAPSHYPPLYYFAALPFFWATGWTLLGARLVSWLSVLGAWAAMGVVIRRAGGSRTAVIIAWGMTAALYAPTRYWYDVARVDAFDTLLVVGGVCAFASHGVRPNRGALFVGALLVVAALAAKQTGVPIAVGPVLWFALVRDRGRALAAATLTATLGVLTLGALWWWTDGGIAACYTIVRHHVTSLDGLRAFLAFSVALVPHLTLSLAGARWAPPREARLIRFVLLNAGLALVVAAVSFVKVGGEGNSAMPAIFLLALTSGLSFDPLWRLPIAPPLRLAGAAALIAFPLVANAVPNELWAAIPAAADRRLADEVWEDMRQTPGPLLAYTNSFASTLLQGEMHAVGDRLYDWAGGFDPPLAHPDVSLYPPDYFVAIRERRYAAIWTARSGLLNDPVEALIREQYVLARAVGLERFPKTSIPRWRWCAPTLKWVPKP